MHKKQVAVTYQAKMLAITGYQSQAGTVDESKTQFQRCGRLKRAEGNSHPTVKLASALRGKSKL